MCARLACAIDVLGCCRSEAMASYLRAVYHSEDSVMAGKGFQGFWKRSYRAGLPL